MPEARDTKAAKAPAETKKAVAASEATAAGVTPAGGNLPHLDASTAGSPVLIGSGPTGAAGGAVSGNDGSSLVPPNDELIVEIQLAPGATSLRSSLVANTPAFL